MKPKITPQSLLEQIAQIQSMERGKLCVIRQGPNGPYYSLQSWENGANHARYVPQDQVAAVQEALAGYEQFKNLTQQYAQNIIEQTRAQRASGLKKKISRPSSSSPKSKRSNN
jgi:hypothetical protein